MASAPILMTADEINCLIHQYFLDSGFNHSAFSLRAEGRLEQSANFQKVIPRGELVELLSKAQLYREVEAHWTGDSLITNCKTRFSLLEDHVCSHDGKLMMSNTIPAPLIEKDLRTIPMHMLDPSVKRKAGTPVDELRSEKKARKDDDLRSSTAQSTPQPEPSALRTVTNDSRGSSTDVTQTDTGSPIGPNFQFILLSSTRIIAIRPRSIYSGSVRSITVCSPQGNTVIIGSKSRLSNAWGIIMVASAVNRCCNNRCT